MTLQAWAECGLDPGIEEEAVSKHLEAGSHGQVSSPHGGGCGRELAGVMRGF